MLFHLSNAAMLPLAGAAVTMRAGQFANLIIAACIVVPQMIVALLSPWVGRAAERIGRKRLLLLGWGALPLRGLLLAVLPGSWPLVMGQAVSGVSAAVFGVMLPLLAADLTLGTSHFNLCMGILGLAMYLGAAVSTTMSGGIADAAGMEDALSCPRRHRLARVVRRFGWSCRRHGQRKKQSVLQFGDDPERLFAADHALTVIERIAKPGILVVPGWAGEMRGQDNVL